MTTYYVDFGATNDGDGSAYTQAASPGAAGAYKTFVGKTFSSGDTVWLRRSSTALALAANYTSALGGVNFYGWPKSGDANYASRPAGPQGTWDGDSADFAKITTNSSSYGFNPTGNNANFARLWVDSSVAGSHTSAALFGLSGSGSTLDQSKVVHSGARLVSSNTDVTNGLNVTGAGTKISNVYIKGNSTSTSYCCLLVGVGAGTCYLKNITIDSNGVNASNYVASFTNSVSNKWIIVDGLTINLLDTGLNYHQGTLIRTATGCVDVRNCVVNNQYNTGSSYLGICLDVTAPRSKVDVTVTAGNAGVLSLNSSTDGKVVAKNWHILYPLTGASPTSVTTTGCPVELGAGSLEVAIINGTFTTNNSGVPFISVNSGAANPVILLDNTNYDQNRCTTAITDGSFTVLSMNHGKTAGAWLMETEKNCLLSAAAARTGGASYSLKGKGKDTALGHSKGSTFLSMRGRETYYVDLPSGAFTVTLYGAYASWSATNKAAPDRSDVALMLSYVDNNGVWQHANTFAIDTALTSDASSWTGDTVTAFKVVITGTTNGAQTRPLNILVSPEYDLNGYVYIDPTITVA